MTLFPTTKKKTTSFAVASAEKEDLRDYIMFLCSDLPELFDEIEKIKDQISALREEQKRLQAKVDFVNRKQSETTEWIQTGIVTVDCEVIEEADLSITVIDQVIDLPGLNGNTFKFSVVECRA